MPDDGRVLNINCREHGRIWTQDVWCRHDSEEAVRRVVEAHGAVYGGQCRSVLDVELLDPTTEEASESVVHPGVEPTEQSGEPDDDDPTRGLPTRKDRT